MFWKNLVALCNAKDTSPTREIKKVGVAQGCVTKWKKGETKPNASTIAKLAEHFGVQDFYFDEENTFFTMKPEFNDKVKKACDSAKISMGRLATEIGVSQNFVEWIDICVIPSEVLLWSIGNHLWTKYQVRFNAYDYILQQGILKKEKPQSEVDELTEYLEELKTRPEMKMLFSVAKGATKEDIEKAVAIIEALRKTGNG